MKARFGHAELAEKMTSQFGGAQQKSIKVEMQYTKEVQTFIKKIQQAQNNAGKSKLVFK